MGTVFDATIHKSQTWVSEVGKELQCDEQRAYQSLRGTFHALRDRLSVEEAVHLGAQLPMLLRGLYFEGWRPSGKPARYGRNEFLQVITSAFDRGEGPDPERAARAVLRVLDRHVSEGELQDVRGILPKELKALWPH